MNSKCPAIASPSTTEHTIVHEAGMPSMQIHCSKCFGGVVAADCMMVVGLYETPAEQHWPHHGMACQLGPTRSVLSCRRRLDSNYHETSNYHEARRHAI